MLHKRLKSYLPFISLVARIKSEGSLNEINPKPLVLLVRLSRTTLAFKNEGYLLKILVNNSSVTSLPKSPQNKRKSPKKKKRTNCVINKSIGT